MSSIYERRENGDGTVSQNVAVTDSDAVLPIDLRDHGMNELNPLVTKSYVSTVTAHNGASIRDTNISEIVVDVSKMTGEKLVVVSTTLNQAVTVTLYAESSLYAYASAGAKAGMTSGAQIMHSNEFGALKGPIQKLKIRVVAAAAPTSGSISTYVEGVQA
jgi:hypothetical protein